MYVSLFAGMGKSRMGRVGRYGWVGMDEWAARGGWVGPGGQGGWVQMGRYG